MVLLNTTDSELVMPRLIHSTKRYIAISERIVSVAAGKSTMAPTIKKEAQRLKVLWQYDVLDTVPEEVFDDLTELAARICEAPVALISLIDEDRQWFKAKVGVTLSETSRDISFCAHAIKQTDLFIIPDATQDARFAKNPLVISDPKIRFYAGAPLITPDGHALGTLCVIDKVPRQLRPEQQQALRVLSRHVMTQLELRRHAKELAEVHQAKEETNEELEQLRAENAQLKRELEKLKKGKPAKKR
jgi:two-component system, cell cycle sensor histidine kinase and response regulator CckA